MHIQKQHSLLVIFWKREKLLRRVPCVSMYGFASTSLHEWIYPNASRHLSSMFRLQFTIHVFSMLTSQQVCARHALTSLNAGGELRLWENLKLRWFVSGRLQIKMFPLCINCNQLLSIIQGACYYLWTTVWHRAWISEGPLTSNHFCPLSKFQQSGWAAGVLYTIVLIQTKVARSPLSLSSEGGLCTLLWTLGVYQFRYIGYNSPTK